MSAVSGGPPGTPRMMMATGDRGGAPFKPPGVCVFTHSAGQSGLRLPEFQEFYSMKSDIIPRPFLSTR